MIMDRTSDSSSTHTTMNDDQPYTIITGASGGLGTSFALECAGHGRNLILIDLPGRQLSRLSDFLQRNFPIRVRALEIDLRENGAAEKVADEIRKHHLRVYMLINNAALNQNETFVRSDAGYMRRMVEVNCISYFTLIHELLPFLKKEDRSIIINVSSLAGFFPLPRKTCYSASKAFVRQYSQALRMELSGTGVSVSILCPGAMTTNIDNYLLHRQLNWFSRQMLVHPSQVARMTLRAAAKGKEIIIPGRLNRLVFNASMAIPAFLKKRLLRFSMKQLKTEHDEPVSSSERTRVPVEKEAAGLGAVLVTRP